ncbi:MAG: ankyrin repeat domain-containing protein [Verrucomicrobiota bacterium]|jgi:ankyrin repeat protein|nr:ankyrin repeat domain-containing protein [Verrucomicrobiota bacterium]
MKSILLRFVLLVFVVSLPGCRVTDYETKVQPAEPVSLAYRLNEPGFSVAATAESPLHRAVRKGGADGAKRIMALGLSVDAQNQFGVTPLHIATTQGQNDLVALLLGNGANPNGVTHAMQTALHFAALQGNASVAELLIDHGAAVNSLDHKHWTPLDCAIWRGSGITFTDIDGKKALAQLLAKKGGRRGHEISPEDH